MDQFLSFLQSALSVAFVVAVVYAMALDFNTARIPNWLTVPLALGFLPAALVAGLPPAEILVEHYGAGALVLLGGALLFARRWIGGGDVKLLTALGVWVGWKGLPDYLLVTAVGSGVLALIALVFRAPVGVQLTSWLPFLDRGFDGGEKVPLGVAIGAAGLYLLQRLDVVPRGWLPLFQ